MACTFSREGISTVTVQVSAGNIILQDRKNIAVHGELQLCLGRAPAARYPHRRQRGRHTSTGLTVHGLRHRFLIGITLTFVTPGEKETEQVNVKINRNVDN